VNQFHPALSESAIPPCDEMHRPQNPYVSALYRYFFMISALRC